MVDNRHNANSSQGGYRMVLLRAHNKSKLGERGFAILLAQAQGKDKIFPMCRHSFTKVALIRKNLDTPAVTHSSPDGNTRVHFPVSHPGLWIRAPPPAIQKETKPDRSPSAPTVCRKKIQRPKIFTGTNATCLLESKQYQVANGRRLRLIPSAKSSPTSSL